MNYWFKPKRFWKWFAAYYPVSWQGWLTVIILFIVLLAGFYWADYNSHSASEALVKFAPILLIVLLIFDLLSFRMGEYPAWWRSARTHSRDYGPRWTAVAATNEFSP